MLTLDPLADDSSMYKVILLRRSTYPVSPANLTLHDQNSLVGGMVPKVLEGYPSRGNRKVYRTYRGEGL